MADKMNSIERAIDRLMQKGAKSLNGNSNSGPNVPITKTRLTSTRGHQVGKPNQSNPILEFDMQALRDLGYVTPLRENKEMSEQFRLIKRPLLLNVQGKSAAPIDNANLIMVTSSLPNEGKTFMSLNCALSMVSEKNTTVLLIDSDVVNPSLSRMLGVENQPGLIDVLNGVCDLSDVLLNTHISGLRFLPAGLQSEDSTELLSSERMHNFTQEVARRYPDRVIIFDSSPLLVTSQAVVLSHYMGQIVVVVEAAKTPQHVLKEAIDLLKDNDVVSLILNKTRKSTLGGYYYGSYYGATSAE